MRKPSQLVPKYAVLPLLAALTVNCAVFWATRPLTRACVHYDLTTPLDRAIPFVPAFIIIYVLAFVQWLCGYIVICRESPERCFRVMSGEIISKLICCVFFLAMPTAMTRPQVTGGGIFERLTGLIYALDTPDNLFPSIHCLESWLCFRGTAGAGGIPRGYKAATLAFTLLVFASTVLVKQHLVADVVSGVLVAEAGQIAASRLHTGRIFEKLNARVYGETL